MNLTLMLVIAAGLLAVLYGAAQTASLLRASPGNAKMQEIAAAIQEGAQAYLNKQYTAIAIVGVVILVAVFFLIGPLAAGRISTLADFDYRECARAAVDGFLAVHRADEITSASIESAGA